METIILNNGVDMPVMGFGTWDLRGSDCVRAVEDALACGYRLIDTAQMYDNEEEVGLGMRRSGIGREDIFLTTKVCRPNLGYESTKRAIDRSLKKLGTDYIDLYLIHESYQEAPLMYRAMEEACNSGKIRAIGISNFNAALYRNFMKNCEIIPAVNQVEAHVFFAQASLQRLLESYGTYMEAWSPLAAGKNGIFTNDTLTAVGRQYGKKPAQVALRYLIQRQMIVIPKSANKARMRENMDIFDFTLSESDMEKIGKLDKNRSLFGWY